MQLAHFSPLTSYPNRCRPTHLLQLLSQDQPISASRDVNQMIRDWVGVGHWLPQHPYKPIGLVGAILAWHDLDDLDGRPTAAEMARDAADLTAHHHHLTNQAAARTEAARRRVLGRQALRHRGRCRRPALRCRSPRRPRCEP
jgi:hypothetical protein